MSYGRMSGADVVASIASVLNTYSGIFNDPYVTGSYGTRPSDSPHFQHTDFKISNRLTLGQVYLGDVETERLGGRLKFNRKNTYNFLIMYNARVTHKFTDPNNSKEYVGQELVVHYLDKVQRGMELLGSAGSLPTLRNFRFESISNPAQHANDPQSWFAVLNGTCQHITGSNI